MATTYNSLHEKLSYEFDRRGLSTADIAASAGLPSSVVDGYLSDTQEMKFNEFAKMCRSAGINPIRILTKAWRPMQLTFRNASSQAKRVAEDVENVFLLILPAMDRPRNPDISRPDTSDTEATLLIAEINNKVADLKSRHTTVEALYDAYSVPVYGMDCQDGFDAFLLRDQNEKKALAVFNTNMPTSRIEVSMLHEFAHFLFDKDTIIPIDDDMETNPKDFYGTKIPTAIIHEYIAVKFAQLWLVPYQVAESIYSKSVAEIAEAAAEMCVSPEVMANALYDVGRSMPQGRRKAFALTRDEIKSVGVEWTGRKPVREWLRIRSEMFVSDVAEFGKENMSDDVFSDVMRVLHCDV